MIDRLWDETTNDVFREAVGPLARGFELSTHLGDGVFLIVLAIALYWFGDRGSRRERAFVIALGTAALALAAGLKGIFLLPRPETAFTPEYYPGYTFPSAHAMGAAAFYGGLAVTMRSGKKWQRFLAAGAVIVLVALSRVILGVHYLGDVLVGAGLGLLLVWIGLQWRREGRFAPGLIFLLAGGIALLTVYLGSREYVTLVIGVSFGGAAGWWYASTREQTDRGAAILLAGIVLVVGLVVARVGFAILGSVIPGSAPTAGMFLAEIVVYGVLTAIVMALPALAVVIEDHELVAASQQRLPFRGRRVDLDEIAQE